MRGLGIYIKKNYAQFILIFSLIVIAVMVFYPFWLTVIKSFKDATQDVYNPYTITFPFHFENYTLAWAYVNPYFINSLIIAVLETIGSLFIASITAFGFTRFNFPFKNTIYIAILALMMVPSTLTLIPKYMLIKDLGLINSFSGIIVPGLVGGLPFRLMLLRTFFAGVPNDLFEAADIDGANQIKQYIHVMLPLCLPILSVLAVNNFWGCWNGVIWPKLILIDEAKYTIPIGIIAFTNEYQGLNRGAMGAPLAAYVISSIPLILIFSVASKQFIRGLTSGAFKM